MDEFLLFSLAAVPHFERAKSFLQSNAWDSFTVDSSGNATSCPSVNIPTCKNFEVISSVILEPFEEDLDVEGLPFPSMTLKKRKAKGNGKAPISDDDVRRSERLKKVHKGFKAATCKDKNCLGCSSTRPSISPKIIRCLGATFCDLDPKDLTEEKLNVQPKRKSL